MDEHNKYQIDWPVMTECMTESVLITDANLHEPGPYIIYVNPAFEKMTGWSKEEAIGKNPRILQGVKTELGIFQNLAETLQKGETWSGKTINYRKDGSEFYMEWSVVPIRNEEWIIHQYLAVQKDVTHLVRTEQKLQISRDQEQQRLLEIERKNKRLRKLIENQRKTLDLFVKYVPEPIVKKALSEKKKNIKKGQQLEIALLFCDIRRFTTAAEGLDPEETVHLLNVYYSMMSEVVNQHNGFINQFVGDEIFVSFGAPMTIDNPEVSALQCARDMIRKLDDINEALKDTIEDEIIVGIGINFGKIIAGNLGSDDRLSYSITGDAVNTAKRIESLTKDLPNTILISQSIFNKTRHIVNTKPWGEVEVKGKNKKIDVYQVID